MRRSASRDAQQGWSVRRAADMQLRPVRRCVSSLLATPRSLLATPRSLVVARWQLSPEPRSLLVTPRRLSLVAARRSLPPASRATPSTPRAPPLCARQAQSGLLHRVPPLHDQRMKLQVLLHHALPEREQHLPRLRNEPVGIALDLARLTPAPDEIEIRRLDLIPPREKIPR